MRIFQSRQWVRGIVAGLVVTQLSACGTLLYPERRGQTSGTIDVGIALLNALGLVFFFIPGVVAFGVDFMTGGIYYPDGRVSTLSEEEMKRISPDHKTIDMNALKQVLAEHDSLDWSEFSATQLNAQPMASHQAMMEALNSPWSSQQKQLAKAY
ncbi:hypothetical protein [Marinomonas pollencensis]|uniref:Uncharacterized protein n=1 Tax=Marinomonas pollencensis TaxID=491954 RepID=A0A3E0DN53_9GAMM|nr:hypothetical protein [Marinomonas pollencensis]REG84143.1 hypothetical protein DFP81_10422 [Marinomonas pollencensis]